MSHLDKFKLINVSSNLDLPNEIVHQIDSKYFTNPVSVAPPSSIDLGFNFIGFTSQKLDLPIASNNSHTTSSTNVTTTLQSFSSSTVISELKEFLSSHGKEIEKMSELEKKNLAMQFSKELGIELTLKETASLKIK